MGASTIENYICTTEAQLIPGGLASKIAMGARPGVSPSPYLG